MLKWALSCTGTIKAGLSPTQTTEVEHKNEKRQVIESYCSYRLRRLNLALLLSQVLSLYTGELLQHYHTMSKCAQMIWVITSHTESTQVTNVQPHSIANDVTTIALFFQNLPKPMCGPSHVLIDLANNFECAQHYFDETFWSLCVGSCINLAVLPIILDGPSNFLKGPFKIYVWAQPYHNRCC